MNRTRLTTRIAAYSKEKKEIKRNEDLKRDIHEDTVYDTANVKHIKKILHNVNVAMGNLTGALKDISTVKGPEISPDGLLGGKGYIMSLKDLKGDLADSIHKLAGIGDTLADELNNPKWGLDEKDLNKIQEERNNIDQGEESVEENLDEEKERFEEEPTEEITTEEETEPEEPSETSEEQAPVEAPPEQEPAPEKPEEETQKPVEAGFDIRSCQDGCEDDVAQSIQLRTAMRVDPTRDLLARSILANLVK
jgi:hypothetical protein